MINPSDEILNGEESFIITDNTDGSKNIELATEVIQAGTNINRDVLNYLQGMGTKNTTFNDDGTITETDGSVTKTTTFNENGSILEVIMGGDSEQALSKLTTFNDDGTIDEEIIENEEGEVIE